MIAVSSWSCGDSTERAAWIVLSNYHVESEFDLIHWVDAQGDEQVHVFEDLRLSKGETIESDTIDIAYEVEEFWFRLFASCPDQSVKTTIGPCASRGPCHLSISFDYDARDNVFVNKYAGCRCR